MLGRYHSQVLIVGAGPVGLFTALRLAERDVRVAIVDKHWRTGAHSYALALHPRSLEMLDEMGLAGPLVERGHRIDEVAFWHEGSERAVVRFAELGGSFPFALVMPQARLEDDLEKALRRHKVKVRWNHRLDSFLTEGDEIVADVAELDQVAAGYPIARLEWMVVRSFSHRAGYLVGADGYHSSVRRRLGVDFSANGPLDTYAVFEFQSPTAPDHRLRVVVDDGLASAMWPMLDGRSRWAFQLAGDERPETGRDLLNRLIDERAPWYGRVDGDIYWSSLVQFDRRLAAGLGRGRTWLAGDAVHLGSPVGVQSMNSGLLDGRELADALTAALGGDTAAPSRYAARRLSELTPLFGGSDGFIPGDGCDAFVREHRREIVGAIPATGEQLERLAAQIGLVPTGRGSSA